MVEVVALFTRLLIALHDELEGVEMEQIEQHEQPQVHEQID